MIVVTVDLLTTGIDVPEITNLVFMRRIKSRILFEQMLGRVTRLCPSIHKTHFEIYDPVGVYESLEDVSNMKPVVMNPFASFDDLLNGLTVAKTDEEKAHLIDTIVAKPQRKRAHTSKNATEQFMYLTGGQDITTFARNIKSENLTRSELLGSASPKTEKINKLIEKLLSNREAFLVLDNDKHHGKRSIVIDDHDDKLIEHTRGYGDGKKPEDYIEAFKQFVTEHLNDIAALKIVCTKPSELTREDLRTLLMELDRHEFTEKELNSAWKERTNQDIAADIIAFICQQAIGSALVSHETRVKIAFAKVKLNHAFNSAQINWLNRIEKTMLEESVLDKQIFEMGAFKNAGGFVNIDKRFGGKLSEIVTEINQYLYDNGGNIA